MMPPNLQDHIDSMGRVYKRWSSMLRSLGINRVDLLKIDVEVNHVRFSLIYDTDSA